MKKFSDDLGDFLPILFAPLIGLRHSVSPLTFRLVCWLPFSYEPKVSVNRKATLLTRICYVYFKCRRKFMQNLFLPHRSKLGLSPRIFLSLSLKHTHTTHSRSLAHVQNINHWRVLILPHTTFFA